MGEHTFDESGEAAGSVMARVIDDDETLTGVRLARLGAIADLDRTRDFQYDGYPSATAFLIHRCGMGAGEAKREVFLARSMRHMPYAVKSAYAGHISITQLELLAYARSRHPDLFEADESTLVASVSGLTTAETRRVVDYWCQADDQPSDLDDYPEPSRAHLSKTLDGRWRLDGVDVRNRLRHPQRRAPTSLDAAGGSVGRTRPTPPRLTPRLD